jgi:hypothetical protein
MLARRSFKWQAALIGISLTCGIAVASLAPKGQAGHATSLRAVITTADGNAQRVTLEGVGCPTGVCSRVKAKDVSLDTIWLDGLAEVSSISHAPGPVTATFRFKDGSQREVSIITTNRVLYVKRASGRMEQLDLGALAKIQFE